MSASDFVPLPPKDDVVVWVIMQDGTRYESPPQWASTSDTDKHTIRMHRDRESNYERRELPDWLPDDVDPTHVKDVGVRLISG